MARHTVTPEVTPGFIPSVLKPLLISLFATFLSLAFLAICIAYGPVTEQAASRCILASTALCIFLSGFLTVRSRKGRGFLLGALAGILYVVAAYLCAVLAFGDFSPDGGFVKLVALGILFGALGGIVGVNTRRKKR